MSHQAKILSQSNQIAPKQKLLSLYLVQNSTPRILPHRNLQRCQQLRSSVSTIYSCHCRGPWPLLGPRSILEHTTANLLLLLLLLLLFTIFTDAPLASGSSQVAGLICPMISKSTSYRVLCIRYQEQYSMHLAVSQQTELMATIFMPLNDKRKAARLFSIGQNPLALWISEPRT